MNRPEPAVRSFLQGCGDCGREWRVQGLKRVLFVPADAKACERDHEYALTTTDSSGQLIDLPVTVADEAGWCVCGDSDLADAAAFAYLDWLDRKHAWIEAQTPELVWKDPRWVGLPETPLEPTVHSLMELVCDDLGWTEHGGSVRGAWLSEVGKEALAELRSRQKEVA